MRELVQLQHMIKKYQNFLLLKIIKKEKIINFYWSKMKIKQNKALWTIKVNNYKLDRVNEIVNDIDELKDNYETF